METYRLVHWFWLLSLAPVLITCSHWLIFSMFWFFMFIMLNVMSIRLVIYIFSIWDTLMFIWIIFLCSHYTLAIVCILDLKHASILIIMFVFFALHVLITCLNVVFIKTCVYTCTTNEPHLIIVCLCLIAHLCPLDVLE